MTDFRIITSVPLTSIIIPEWDWHFHNSTLVHRLEASLYRHGQLRPLIVRETDAGLELVEGRQLYNVLVQTHWETASIINLGSISREEAVLVALSLELRQDIDYVKLAEEVTKIIESRGEEWITELTSTTPFDGEQVEYFQKLSRGFDWSQFHEETGQTSILGGDEDAEHYQEVLDEEAIEVVGQTPKPPESPLRTEDRPRRPTFPLAPDPVPQPTPAGQTPVQNAVPVPVPDSEEDLLDAWDAPVVPAGPRHVPAVQFHGIDTPLPSWTAQEPPALDGIDNVAVNFETDGVRWQFGDRPIGITVGTLDKQLVRFLPFGFAGGNLSEDTVKRWAERELRGKHIINANTGFEVHMSRVWGVDLEAQGCTVSDVQHDAALLDEYRRQFALDVLAEEMLGGVKVPRVDESRMSSYHAAEVAARAEYQVQLVADLRATMWPKLVKEDLEQVHALEDSVIYPVCEMEKNAAIVNRSLLKEWVQTSAEKLQEALFEINNDVGFTMNPDKTSDWESLFTHYGIPITERTDLGAASFTDDVLSRIDHPQIQKARRVGKLASLRSKFLQAYDLVVGDDNKLRFSLHQLRGDEYGTIRGRFSMSGGSKGQPRFGANLQQVFSVDKQREAFGFDGDDSSHDEEIFLVRKLFIPEVGDYLTADAQSIEYRIAAHFASAQKLIAAYKENPWADFHEVVRGFVAPYKKISRKTTKNLNFAKIYGAGRDKIAQTLRMDRKESDEVVLIYDNTFPEFKALHDLASHLANKRGWVKTLSGRRARFPDKMWCHKALNYAIQGSAADIMKTKIVELHRERKTTGFIMRQTVHDEVDGDATIPETMGMVREILNHQSFDLQVPILWNVAVGRTWADAK